MSIRGYATIDVEKRYLTKHSETFDILHYMTHARCETSLQDLRTLVDRLENPISQNLDSICPNELSLGKLAIGSEHTKIEGQSSSLTVVTDSFIF